MRPPRSCWFAPQIRLSSPPAPPLPLQFLGLHSHAQGEAHDHHGAAEDPNTLWKLLAVLGGLYLFFLLEKFFVLLGHSDDEVGGLLTSPRPWAREALPLPLWLWRQREKPSSA